MRYSRPIFISSRDFDFETAIWDCRSSALMKSLRPQADVASNERFSGRRVAGGSVEEESAILYGKVANGYDEMVDGSTLV